MVAAFQCFRRWVLVLLLLPLVACSPAAGVEPTAELAATIESPATAPTLAAYPSPPTATPTLPPYPWPTATPGPTDPPEPTEPPTETPPPDPTVPPTPVVTPVPTAEPPFIPFPDGTTAQPFTLYWRDGDVLRSMRSDEGEPKLFLDPAAEFGLYLLPPEASTHSWGAASADGRNLALVLTEESNPTIPSGGPYPAHIYLFDPEKRSLHPLVEYGYDPVWSPDGKQIAYVSAKTGGLWTVDIATGGSVEVYAIDKANEHSISSFSWAPDSQYLVAMDSHSVQSASLVLIDANRLGTPQVLVGASTEWVSDPQWSPTGDEITFLWFARRGGEGPDLWITNSDGTNQQQLTHGIRVLGGRPLWSPDGKWVVFSRPASFEMPFPLYDLWLTNSTALDLKRLSADQIGSSDDDGIDELHPLWSPDGTQLVFTGVSQKDTPEVWMMSLIDGTRRKLISRANVLDNGLLVAP